MVNASDQGALSEPTKSEWKARFAQPHSPACLNALVGELHELGGDQFVTDNTMTWAREAHVSGRFASAIDASSAWIADRPDLGVEMPDGTKAFYEITEVIEPGRRRNDEYREDRARQEAEENAVRHFQPDNVSSTRSALKQAAEKKTRKIQTYGSSCGLVLYLNTDLMVFDDVAAELEEHLHADTSAAGNAFTDVWVLWSDRLYNVWSGGSAVPLSPKLNV